MEQSSPAVLGPVESSVKPSTLAAFFEAVNGRCGDLDAWLECNNEAEVRAHVLALVKAERERFAVIAETSHPHDWAFIGSAIRNGGA
jgi:hypothetical protein